MNYITTRRCLLITILLTIWVVASNAAENCVAPLKQENVIIQQGQKFFPIKVTNYGKEAVSTITYSLYDTGQMKTVKDETITLDSLLPTGESIELKIALTDDNPPAKQTLWLNITQVNGKANEATEPYTYLTLYIVSRIPTKRMLVEDYTGMWCGYCPRGIVTMEYLRRQYPDKFIGVTIHCRNGSVDYLDVNAYGEVHSKWATGFPSVWVNRWRRVTDWNEGDWAFAQAITSPATTDIEVQAVWANDSNDIEIETKVTPCMAADTSRYGIGYVLIEDGMTGAFWPQANYFSGEYYANAPEEFNKFTNGGSYIYGLTFDHTAITSKGIDKGMEGSFAEPLQPEVSQLHYTSFTDIAQHSIIQNKDSLSVVAMVIDRETGQVDNAAICRIVDGELIGIKSVSAAHNPTARSSRRYNIYGQPVGADYKGIVIKDGKKILQ